MLTEILFGMFFLVALKACPVTRKMVSRWSVLSSFHLWPLYSIRLHFASIRGLFSTLNIITRGFYLHILKVNFIFTAQYHKSLICLKGFFFTICIAYDTTTSGRATEGGIRLPGQTTNIEGYSMHNQDDKIIDCKYMWRMDRGGRQATSGVASHVDLLRILIKKKEVKIPSWHVLTPYHSCLN